MAETLQQVVTKIYSGSGGLNTGQVNPNAIQYNISKARTLGASAIQMDLLNKAFQMTGSGNYQGAATQIWYVLGSPANNRPNYTQKAAQASQQQAAAKAAQTIDPQKQSGYTFKVTMSHADQNNYINAKKSKPNLTEYEWRKANGKDISVSSGRYVAPAYTSSNKSGATAKNQGSNGLTGSQKLAAQSKVNPTTNKAVVVNKTPTKPAAPKVTVSLKAASSGNAAKTSVAVQVQTAKKSIVGVDPIVTKPTVKSVSKPVTPAKTVGVSNNLTGSQKLAAQSKVNAATNKPTIIARPVVKPTIVATPVSSKPTMLEAAGLQLKTGLTGYTTKVTAPVTTQEKAAVVKTLKLTQSNKSGFGFIGVASGAPSSPYGKLTAEDRQKYSKDPRFKPCPTGLCSVKWANDQMYKLRAADYYSSSQGSEPTTIIRDVKTQQNTQKPQIQNIPQITQTPKTIQTPQNIPKTIQQNIPQAQTPQYIPQTLAPISSTLRNSAPQDDEWNEAVQDILKQNMMARYGLDSRGNKIGNKTGSGVPIKLADGSYMEQIQKQGNSGTGSVTIYSSKQAMLDTKAAQAAAANAARAEQAKRQAEYLQNPLVDKTGQIINPIVNNKGQPTISRNVLGNTTTVGSPLGTPKSTTEKTTAIYNALVKSGKTSGGLAASLATKPTTDVKRYTRGGDQTVADTKKYVQDMAKMYDKTGLKSASQLMTSNPLGENNKTPLNGMRPFRTVEQQKAFEASVEGKKITGAINIVNSAIAGADKLYHAASVDSNLTPTELAAKQKAIADYRKQGKIQNVLGSLYDNTEDVASIGGVGVSGVKGVIEVEKYGVKAVKGGASRLYGDIKTTTNLGVTGLGIAGSKLANNSKNADLQSLGKGWENFSMGDRKQNAIDLGTKYLGVVNDELKKVDTPVSEYTKNLASADEIKTYLGSRYKGSSFERTINKVDSMTSEVVAGVYNDNSDKNTIVQAVNAGKFAKDVGRGVNTGVRNIVGETYDQFRLRPVTSTAEAIAIAYLLPEATGFAYAGGQTLLKAGIQGSAELLEKQATKSLAKGLLRKAIIGTEKAGFESAGETVVGSVSGGMVGGLKTLAKGVDPAAKYYFQYEIGKGAVNSVTGAEGATAGGEGLAKYGLTLAATLPGFHAGGKAANKFFHPGEAAKTPWSEISARDKLSAEVGKEDVIASVNGKFVNGKYEPGLVAETTVRFSKNKSATIEMGDAVASKVIDVNGKKIEVPSRRMATIDGRITQVNVDVKVVNGSVVEIARVPTSSRYVKPTISGTVKKTAIKTKNAIEEYAADDTRVILEIGANGKFKTPNFRKPSLAELKLKVQAASISRLEGQGSETHPVSVVFGKTLTIGDKPILTHVKGDGSITGLKLGAGSAPKKVLNKVVIDADGNVKLDRYGNPMTYSFQPHSALENRFFEATVKEHGQSPIELKYLKTGLKIGKVINEAPTTQHIPRDFQITSTAIPEAMRPTILDFIKSSNGDIIVKGSGATKAQVGDYFGRKPKDLELYTPDSVKAANDLAAVLKAKGYKEGIDFAKGVNADGTPAHQFLIKNAKGELQTGIEFFEHKVTEAGKSDIGFNFSEKEPVLMGSKRESAIKTLSPIEQVFRKTEGSMIFKDGIIQPRYAGRTKDIGDLVDTAAGINISENLPLEQTIVNFASLSVDKFHNNPNFDIFTRTTLRDPVFNKIARTQRIPKIEEVPKGVKVSMSKKSPFAKKGEKTVVGSKQTTIISRKNKVPDTLNTLSHMNHAQKYTRARIGELSDKADNKWTLVNIGAAKNKVKEVIGVRGGKTYTVGPDTGGDHVNMRSRGSVFHELMIDESSPTMLLQRAQMQPSRKGEVFSTEKRSLAAKALGVEKPKLVEGAINRVEIRDRDGNLITSRSEREAALKAIQAGDTSYTYDKPIDMLGTAANPAPVAYASVATKTGLRPGSSVFVKDGETANRFGTSRRTYNIKKSLEPVVDKLGVDSIPGKVIAKIGKTEQQLTTFKEENARVSNFEGDKVKLPKELREAIIKEYAEDSNVEGEGFSKDLYQQVYDIAYKQSLDTGRPVVIPAPKTQAGILHQENEVLVVMAGEAGIVRQVQSAGKTTSDVKVEKVVLGKQPKLKTTRLGNYAENAKHNLSVGVDKYAIQDGKIFYNKKMQASEEQTTIYDRVAENYLKTQVTKPGAWEDSLHGPIHTNTVGDTAVMIAEKNPWLKIDKNLAKLSGTAHDLDKIGGKDQINIEHGVVAARAIRNRKTGLPEIDKLPENQLNELADAVAYHTTRKPWTSGNLKESIKTSLFRGENALGKALPNADRMDMVRFGDKIDQNQLFNLNFRHDIKQGLKLNANRIKDVVVLPFKGGLRELKTNEFATLGSKGIVRETKAELKTVEVEKNRRLLARSQEKATSPFGKKYELVTGSKTTEVKEKSVKELYGSKPKKTTAEKASKDVYGVRDKFVMTDKKSVRELYNPRDKTITAKSKETKKPTYPERTTRKPIEKPTDKEYTRAKKVTPKQTINDKYTRKPTSRVVVDTEYNKKAPFKPTPKVPDYTKPKDVVTDKFKYKPQEPSNKPPYEPVYDGVNDPYTPPYIPPYDGGNDPYVPPYDGDVTDPYIPPNDDNPYGEPYVPPTGGDPYYPPPPDQEGSDYGGGSGDGYEGYIPPYDGYVTDQTKILRRRKVSDIETRRPRTVQNAALMISKTKVNTFAEMMGNTGKKASYGSEQKVTKTERPSPFNKKVTMSTIESYTPVVMDMAQVQLERKIKTVAKTPAKVTVGKTVVTRRKTVETTQKSPFSKPPVASKGRMPIQKVNPKTASTKLSPVKKQEQVQIKKQDQNMFKKREQNPFGNKGKPKASLFGKK